MLPAATNAQVLGCRQLHKPRCCLDTQRYLLEGDHLVREALAEGTPLEAVFLTDEYRSAQDLAAFSRPGLPLYTATPAQMQRMTQTVTPQGVCAVAIMPPQSPPDALRSSRVLVLDNVQDPGNTGTLLRSAEACGFGCVIACGGASLWQNKCIRASMGSILRLELYQTADIPALLGQLRRQEYALWAAALNGRPYNPQGAPERLALFIGNEARGVCPEVLQQADLWALPMGGRVESFNAAVAGSIIMYDLYRQATGG